MESINMLAVVESAGQRISHYTDAQNMIQLGFLMLLVSLLVSCRHNNSWPCLLVSAVCALSTYIAIGLHFIPPIESSRELLMVLPAAFMSLLFAITLVIVCLLRASQEALRLHLATTAGCLVCLTLAYNGDCFSVSSSTLGTHMTVATAGFFLVHMLSAASIYWETTTDDIVFSKFLDEKSRSYDIV